MADILRFNPPGTADHRRCAAGVVVGQDGARMSAALVWVEGRGLAMRASVGEGVTAELPAETTACFARLAHRSTQSTPAATLASLATLAARLAEHQAALLDALLSQAGVPPSRVLVVGVIDPGLWTGSSGSTGAYLCLGDPARLAELTGLNVVDAFPARDVVQGGQGGPLNAVPLWLLLRHPRRHRLVVDLGRTTRLAWLPPLSMQDSLPASLRAFDVGPGTQLLDLLAERLTGGEHRFDPGGRLAVQGQRIEPLLQHWLADPYFRRTIPRWHPAGVRPERFLAEALKEAVREGWSVRDLLCTATHFIAEALHMALQRCLPQDARIDEVVIGGGGQNNGLLIREVAAKLPSVPLRRAQELGIAWEALDPACAALLALLHLDQVPANPPEVTGADVPRVLGRLTPGSPLGWQRLLAELVGSKPAVRPLRSAL